MAEHDLVVRGGTVIDGSGGDAYLADVAVSGQTITEVGQVAGAGRQEIDADGAIVTPGFVDIHTARQPGPTGSRRPAITA
jgi:N-acyl-D-aspartate/D-glutamate deacylase